MATTTERELRRAVYLERRALLRTLSPAVRVVLQQRRDVPAGAQGRAAVDRRDVGDVRHDDGA